MRTALAIVVFVLAGCTAKDQNAHVDSTPAKQRPSAALEATPGVDWRTFQGEGFTLRIPPQARTDTGSSHPNGMRGIAIQGPVVSNPEGPEGPAWRLVAISEPNPRRLPLERWVDSVRQERNAASAGDPDSLAWMGAPDTLHVGTERALRLQPYCGDCAAYEIYVPASDRMVVFAIIYDIGIPGNHEEQRALYDAILSTYRPNGAGPRPSA